MLNFAVFPVLLKRSEKGGQESRPLIGRCKRKELSHWPILPHAQRSTKKKKNKKTKQKTITAGRRADAFGFAAAGSFVLHQERNVETLLQRQRPVHGLWKPWGAAAKTRSL